MRSTFTVGPLSFAIEVAALESWLLGAESGEEIVYATGPALPQRAASVVLARELAEDGVIRTHQRRAGGSFEYFAVRKRAALSSAVIAHVAPAQRGDADLDARVLRELCRAANAGLVCPTNAEIATVCGLRKRDGTLDPDRASYRFGKLIGAGAITSEEHGPNRRRIVTIVATGQRTVAGPL